MIKLDITPELKSEIKIVNKLFTGRESSIIQDDKVYRLFLEQFNPAKFEQYRYGITVENGIVYLDEIRANAKTQFPFFPYKCILFIEKSNAFTNIFKSELYDTTGKINKPDAYQYVNDDDIEYVAELVVEKINKKHYECI